LNLIKTINRSKLHSSNLQETFKKFSKFMISIPIPIILMERELISTIPRVLN